MSATFNVIERAGISTDSIDDAVKKVVLEANGENHVAWFEVIEQRGRVDGDGKVEFQVKVKLGMKK